MELDDEHSKCSICTTKFSSDRDNKDPEIRKHLPVLSSSQRCDHWFCHGCILREQLRIAEANNGRVPKWIKCMHCREKTSFNPAEPKYHRLLIDLLARAQKYAAVQVKNEIKIEQMSVDSKRERDTVEYDEERVVKRSKQMSPSPLLVQVKEEPSEYDDYYSGLPLQEIEDVVSSKKNQISQSNHSPNNASPSLAGRLPQDVWMKLSRAEKKAWLTLSRQLRAQLIPGGTTSQQNHPLGTTTFCKVVNDNT